MSELVLIDNDTERRQALAESLLSFGWSVVEADSLDDTSPQSAAGIIAFHHLVKGQIAACNRYAPTIIVSADASISQAVSSMRAGAADYLAWPQTAVELNAALERCKASDISQRENLSQFPLIGESPAMSLIRENIAKVGPTDSPVLISGQSGTGKELVARAVHASSQRSATPLISINCATIPGNLIEAELFGVQNDDEIQSAGLVAAANGGTLFLDEVAELPEPAQAKLLQVVMGEHRRLGSVSSQPVDIRVVATTHRDLDAMVEQGQFRQDLFYRLNVVRLELPPLQARQSDAVIIAEWMLSRTASRLDKEGLSFADDAIDAISSYHWPGNVRELENAIERAVILSDPNTAISQALLAIEPLSEPAQEIAAGAPGDLTSLEDYFVKFVQQHQDQLTETELAEKLGISRKSLWERRQRLNIPRRKTKKRGRRQDSASQ